MVLFGADGRTVWAVPSGEPAEFGTRTALVGARARNGDDGGDSPEQRAAARAAAHEASKAARAASKPKAAPKAKAAKPEAKPGGFAIKIGRVRGKAYLFERHEATSLQDALRRVAQVLRTETRESGLREVLVVRS